MRRRIGLVAIALVLVAGAAPQVAAIDGRGFSCPDGSAYLSTPNNLLTMSQGQSLTIPIEIHRTGCTGEISLFLWFGPPSGATVTFSPNPTAGTTEMITVKTTTATPVGDLNLSLGVQSGASFPDIYLSLNVAVKPSIAPVGTAPRSVLVTGSVIGSMMTPVRTTWSATDPDGVARYMLQRSVDGGAWTTIALPTALSRSITQSLRFGHRYQYRARATDKVGYTGAWVTAKAFVPRIYQQTTSAFASPWRWTTVSTSSASGGSLKYQPYSGSEFSYTLTGSSVAWIGVAGPNRVDNFNVYIDGVARANDRSLYRSSVQYRRVAFVANWPSDVRHVYRVLNLGKIGHSRIDVDAFVVLDQV